MLQLCNRIGNICIRWICNSKVNSGCFPYLFCSAEKVFAVFHFNSMTFFTGYCEITNDIFSFCTRSIG